MTAIIKQIRNQLNSKVARNVRLINNFEQRLFRDALTRAFTAWAPQHWEWVDYLFNEHFLTHRVAPLLATCRQDGIQLDPVKLANIWAEQLTWFDDEMKQKHMAKIVPAATDFLLCFETELRSHFHYLGNTTNKGMSRVIKHIA